MIDERIPNTWFDKPVLNTSLRLPFDKLRANGRFPIVVSLSNRKLRMNGVEGLTMTGHPEP